MITSLTLIGILNEYKTATGIPAVYREFASPPTTNQYIAWLDLGNDPFAADNISYVGNQSFAIEFYSKRNRDFADEKKLEDKLTAHGIYWRQLAPTYINDQAVHVTVYYI